MTQPEISARLTGTDPRPLTHAEVRARALSEVLIKSCAFRAQRVLVCTVHAVVVEDTRNPVPYELQGDVVGRPVCEEQPDGFYLLGATFKTWVKWCDVRDAWVREQAPDPCPRCGGRG